MDDVIFEFNNDFLSYHNKEYGTSLTKNDVVTYSMEHTLKCTQEEAFKRMFRFYSTPEHENAGIIQGASEALTLLKETNELHLISSRGDQIADLTLRWIHKNFPGYFKSIQLTNQCYGLPGKLRSKADVCKELKIDVMVEDSLSQAEDISSAVSKVFLLDCPWNQGELPKNVVRVYSWADIIKQLK